MIVTTNMNGDIMSDLTSALIGGLGFAPSANLGNEVAIFEAVHGSAPKYAGKNVINPTAVLGSAVMMLRHLGEFEAAVKIENAVLVTLEDGKVRTGDVVGYDKGKTLDDGVTPTRSSRTSADEARSSRSATTSRSRCRICRPIATSSKSKTRKVAGIDLFLESPLAPEQLGPSVEKLIAGTPFTLKGISSRGTKVYPAMGAITDNPDHYCARLMAKPRTDRRADPRRDRKDRRAARWAHVEKLQEFDGEMGYTKAQGED